MAVSIHVAHAVGHVYVFASVVVLDEFHPNLEVAPCMGRLASAFWSFQLVHQVLSANFVSVQGTTMRKRCLTDEQRSDAVPATLSPFIVLFPESPGQFCSTRSVLPLVRSANAPPASAWPLFPCFMTLPLLLILLAWTAASSASQGRLMLRIISSGFLVVVSVYHVTTSYDSRPSLRTSLLTT